MRNLSVIVFLFLAGNCFSQSDTALKYSEVIQVEGISKQELYQRARSWANDAFKSSKNVMQIDDKETGEIAGKALFDATISWYALGKRSAATTVNFKFQIIMKDGKYKYIFSDLTDNYYHYLLTSAKENPYQTEGMGKKNLDMIWVSLKESSEPKMINLVNSLKKAMQKKSESDF